MDWYRWRADALVERLRGLGLRRLTGGSARVLEVGPGPIGIASYFPAGRRVAVDPLEDFYGANAVLSRLRSPAVEYVRGIGEQLPCERESFDLAIVENCIDHARDMDGVMGELRRVLVPDGVVYLAVNCRTPVGYVVHRCLSRLRIDPGHPHTFTPRRAIALVRRSGFRVLSRSVGSYAEALREDLSSRRTYRRVKALAGISEFVTSVVARRTGSA
jgi:SAM-dependent methyltransferase